MNTEQREQGEVIRAALTAVTVEQYSVGAVTFAPIPGSSKRVPASPRDREALVALDALLARLSAVEAERDEMRVDGEQMVEMVAMKHQAEIEATDALRAAEARVEALEAGLNDACKALTHRHGLLNPRDPECSPELHCYLCAARAVLAPSQQEEK